MTRAVRTMLSAGVLAIAGCRGAAPGFLLPENRLTAEEARRLRSESRALAAESEQKLERLGGQAKQLRSEARALQKQADARRDQALGEP